MKQAVLIVDDDAELRDLYERFFSDRGYEVETSSNGLDCLRKLREVPPAALVLDLELHWGGSDGVLAWLRQQVSMREIPVILTAAAKATYPQDFAVFVEPPVVNYLRKPFELTALLKCVESAVENNGRSESPSLQRFAGSSELFSG